MALYRLSENHVSRNQNRCALGAAAYRSGTRLEYNNKVYDQSYRNDIIHCEIILPETAPKEFFDRQTLWSAVEQSEKRRDARTAHEILVALQRELKFDTNVALVREFIDTCLGPIGMCVDFAVHRGDAKDNDPIEGNHKEIAPHNPHAHILMTTRHVDKNGFSKLKAREWESWGNPELLIKWREEWACIQNSMFKRKGHEFRT